MADFRFCSSLHCVQNLNSGFLVESKGDKNETNKNYKIYFDNSYNNN